MKNFIQNTRKLENTKKVQTGPDHGPLMPPGHTSFGQVRQRKRTGPPGQLLDKKSKIFLYSPNFLFMSCSSKRPFSPLLSWHWQFVCFCYWCQFLVFKLIKLFKLSPSSKMDVDTLSSGGLFYHLWSYDFFSCFKLFSSCRNCVFKLSVHSISIGRKKTIWCVKTEIGKLKLKYFPI